VGPGRIGVTTEEGILWDDEKRKGGIALGKAENFRGTEGALKSGWGGGGNVLYAGLRQTLYLYQGEGVKEGTLREGGKNCTLHVGRLKWTRRVSRLG